MNPFFVFRCVALCGAFVVLVFLSGLSPVVYMTAFLAQPAKEKYYVVVFCSFSLVWLSFVSSFFPY